MAVRKLKTKFTGRGEVRGFEFMQLSRCGNACLYEVTQPEGAKHYEVFIIQIKQIPKSKDFYEAYPTSNRFGVNAWTYYDFETAQDKYNEIQAKKR